MVAEVQDLPMAQAPAFNLVSIVYIIILLALLIYGIVLFIMSLKVKSKSLKVGIIIPLVVSFFGVIWWAGDESFLNIFDFGAFVALAGFSFGIPLSLISIIASIISYKKLENKALSIASLFYGILYFLCSLYLVIVFFVHGP